MRGEEKWLRTPLDFTPTLIERYGVEEFAIFGRIRWKSGGRVVIEKGSIMAYCEKGDWYFSGLGVEID